MWHDPSKTVFGRCAIAVAGRVGISSVLPQPATGAIKSQCTVRLLFRLFLSRSVCVHKIILIYQWGLVYLDILDGTHSSVAS